MTPAALDQLPQTSIPLYISCGCIWHETTRTLACPAHNRNR